MDEVKPFKVVKVIKYKEEWKNQTDGSMVLTRQPEVKEVPLYLCYKYELKMIDNKIQIPVLKKYLSPYKPNKDKTDVKSILKYEKEQSLRAIKQRENNIEYYKKYIEKLLEEKNNFQNEIKLIDERKIPIHDLTHEKLDLGGEYE